MAKEIADVSFATASRHEKPLLREKFQGDAESLTETGRHKSYPFVVREILGVYYVWNRPANRK